MNHEKIHTSAIRTSHYLFLPLVCGRYYYWYIKLKDKNLAYHNICFEREAYAQEQET
jgi:hypothetical protein